MGAPYSGRERFPSSANSSAISAGIDLFATF